MDSRVLEAWRGEVGGVGGRGLPSPACTPYPPEAFPVTADFSVWNNT